MAVIVRYSAPGDIVTLHNVNAPSCSPRDRDVFIADDASLCVWRHPTAHAWVVIECTGWGDHDVEHWRKHLASDMELSPELLRRIEAVRTQELAAFAQSDRLPGYREWLVQATKSKMTLPIDLHNNGHGLP